MKPLLVCMAKFLSLMLVSFSCHATIISETISDWAEFATRLTIGDGTNSVQTIWSQNTWDKGYFYGSVFGNSDVAYATGITDVLQITDASIFDFESHSVGPLCDADCNPSGVGDFIAMRNIDTGHYGVLRVDDIAGIFPGGTLDATWWFQTDGTSDFSVVSIPSTAWLFSSTLLGLGFIRRRTSRTNSQRQIYDRGCDAALASSRTKFHPQPPRL